MALFSRNKIDHQTDSDSMDSECKKCGPSAEYEATAADLQTLGLAPGASWEEITEAHARLVSDLTPGPNASHRNVSLAEQFLSEVNDAFASLRRIESVA